MPCRSEGAPCPNHKEATDVIKTPHLRVLFEGAQGSGKTSLTKYFSEEVKCAYRRGFPSGEFIKSATSQHQICHASFGLVTAEHNETVIFDRSPISQFVWNARHGTEISACLNCAENAVRVIAAHGPVLITFIDCEPGTCFTRQDCKTTLAINFIDLQHEVEIYRNIHKHLKSLNIPGVQIVLLSNHADLTMDQFITSAKEQLVPLITN